MNNGLSASLVTKYLPLPTHLQGAGISFIESFSSPPHGGRTIKVGMDERSDRDHPHPLTPDYGTHNELRIICSAEENICSACYSASTPEVLVLKRSSLCCN